MRVLVAEDDATSRSLLTRVLTQWGYEVTPVSTGSRAWEVLCSGSAPQLAILDWMMPGMSGVDICRRAREIETVSPPYLILLTARDSKQDIVAGLDAGANDYLGKPFHREELRARLEVGRRFAQLNQKLLETQRSLEMLARTDPLTGISNRRATLERLDAEIAKARRDDLPLGIGMVDVDHFKHVNDTFGHSVGDKVLIALVGRSVAALRPGDALGRFGGEEFLAILPGASTIQVSAVLEDIRRSVEGTPVETEGGPLEVTVSIGGAVRHDESTEQLIRMSDEALYAAKNQGRNQVVVTDLVP